MTSWKQAAEQAWCLSLAAQVGGSELTGGACIGEMPSGQRAWGASEGKEKCWGHLRVNADSHPGTVVLP